MEIPMEISGQAKRAVLAEQVESQVSRSPVVRWFFSPSAVLLHQLGLESRN
jgi:hypothetical protein